MKREHLVRVVSVWCVGVATAFAAPPEANIQLFHLSTDADPDGPFDMSKVQTLIGKDEAKLVACYKKGLAKEPDWSTKSTIDFDVKPNGTVAAVRVADVLPVVETCIAGVVKKWKLPKTGALTATDLINVTQDFELYTGAKRKEENAIGGSMYRLQGSGWGSINDGSFRKPTGQGHPAGGVYNPSSGPRSGQLPVTKLADLKSAGDLDVAIIRRYVKRNMMKLAYCYEKQLLVETKLAGKLTETFTIDAGGNVSDAAATGLKSKPVEDCVTGVVKGILFPKPKSGTVTATLVLEYAPTGG